MWPGTGVGGDSRWGPHQETRSLEDKQEALGAVPPRTPVPAPSPWPGPSYHCWAWPPAPSLLPPTPAFLPSDKATVRKAIAEARGHMEALGWGQGMRGLRR